MARDPLNGMSLPQRTKDVPALAWEMIGYQPNGWAYRHIHRSGARFNTYCTCRQCGKTESLSAEILDALTTPPRASDPKGGYDPPHVGVLSFDYPHAEMSINKFLSRVHKAYGQDWYSLNKNEHTITIPSTGAILRWMSADNPLSVQGWTLSSGFVDEAQNVTDEVWHNFRPCLSVRQAPLFVFGTPDPVPGNSWYYGTYLRGLDEDEPNYHSFTLSCYDNKWATQEDILDAKASMTEREFRMKYLGEWVDAEGSVFRNVDDCFTGTWLTGPEQGHHYALSLDIAKSDDYTVAYVIDVCHSRIVAQDRYNGLDYVALRDRTEDIYHKWRCDYVHMDTTGVGEPVADMLRKKDLSVVGFLFTAKSKSQLIATLAREIEHKRVIFPAGADELRRELKAFRREVTKSGNIVYTAPVNYHDDCVISAALAVYRTRHGGYVRVSKYATF